jgi:DNA-binding NarL/FixJ family response regulator
MMTAMTSQKPAVRSSRPRILLVDDDPSVLAGLRRVLQVSEPIWEIQVASDGRQALRAVADAHFDVVLTDLTMPGIDGFALLAELRRSHPETVRVIHSSQITTLGPERIRHLADAAIPKPSTALDLLSVIRWAERTARKR